MQDITLYGHLTVDKIFDGFVEKQTLGAMANMWRTWKLIAPDLNIGLVPTSVGEALIYVDRESCTRYSNFVSDIKVNKPIIKESKMSHALYINKLPDVSWLADLTGTISADVCAGPKVDTNLLQNIDYLFIADEDAYADLKTMCKDTKGYVILHTNKSSVISDGRYENTFKIDEEMFVPKSNVLGAGDMFASSFLYGIHLGLPIDQTQKYAHETTSKLITSANEEI